MKIIKQIQDVNIKQWESLLQTSSCKSFFQTQACYNLYAANSSFMKPFFVGIEENAMLKGVIVGFIQADGRSIKRFLSRRAIINGGPLLANDISDEAIKALLIHCKKMLKGKAIYIESRNYEDYSCYKNVFMECGFEYSPHLNFHIITTTEDIVNQNLGKSRKRDIKTSLRDGAEIIESPSLHEVEEFYTILYDLYTKKVKTPLYPFSFFANLYQHDFSKFLLIKYNGHIIGGTICVCLSGHAVYEWFACGVDGAYKNIYPSTLATFAGIRYAARNGYNHFDMMGAGKPNESYGVRDFKAKFGGQLVEHGRFLLILNHVLYQIGKIGVSLMKKF